MEVKPGSGDQVGNDAWTLRIDTQGKRWDSSCMEEGGPCGGVGAAWGRAVHCSHTLDLRRGE